MCAFARRDGGAACYREPPAGVEYFEVQGSPERPTQRKIAAANADLITRLGQWYRRLFTAWLAMKQRLVPTERQRLFGLTIAIGGACGLAAVAFHVAIEQLEGLAIERAMGASGYTWIPWTLVAPALGGLIAGLVLFYVVPNARGSGIPQVKVAYAAKGGRLRLRDSVGKFFVGAMQIGTGASLGREGPTVQICAGVATSLGRLAGVSQQNVRRMIPVGAAAGIAAAFNAPIAAVTFTIEEIVGTLDQTLLSGVIVAAALAAVVERSVLGVHPIFELPIAFGLDSASSLVLYAFLGVAAAFVSVAFTESLLKLRAWFRKLKRFPKWAQPAVGGLLTGGLAVVALLAFQQQGVTGGGYGLLASALSGNLVVKVLLCLCLMKLLATVCSYSSGGAGGIFAPSLCIGGMLGGAVGYLDVAMFGHSHATVGSFALVGMGAVFAGIIRAPITSILIIIEMTNGYSLILPLMIANMSAYGLARALRPVPIYEALLEQDGIHLPTQRPVFETVDAMPLEDFPALDRDFVVFSPGLSATEMLKISSSISAGRHEVFPVVDDDEQLIGIVTLEDLTLLAAHSQLHDGLVNAHDLMHPPVSLPQHANVRAAFELLLASKLREIPVIDDQRHVIAVIDEVSVAHAYMAARHASEEALKADAAGSSHDVPAQTEDKPAA